jgi:hypothetical protein
MKAKELAEILLKNPEMDVAIAPFGGDNRWSITRVAREKRDDICDSELLGEEFLEVQSIFKDL